MKRIVASPFLAILLFSSVALPSARADWRPFQVFTADEHAEDDSGFGTDVAADGDWMVIGQPFSADGGKVHIFQKTNGAWSRTQVISNPAGADGSQFGRRLDIDGTTAIVSSSSPLSNANSRAYVLEETGGTWAISATLSSVEPARSNAFASEVAVSGDIILVGDNFSNYNGVSQQGSIDVFRRDGMGNWFNKLLGGVLEEQIHAGGGVNPQAWIFGNAFDLSGGQALATARVRTTDLPAAADQIGLYPSFDDPLLEGGTFDYPSGAPAPIRPDIAMVSGASYVRPSRVALQDDSRAVALVTHLDATHAVVATSFVPLTRIDKDWSFGDPIQLDSDAAALAVDGNLALVLIADEFLVLEESSAWNVLDRFAPPTGVSGSVAVLGQEFFVGAANADGAGTGQGVVQLYRPRINTKPIITLKGGRKITVSSAKAKLAGTVRDDTAGTRLEATYRQGRRAIRKQIRVASSGRFMATLPAATKPTRATLTATDADGAKSIPVKVTIRRRP